MTSSKQVAQNFFGKLCDGDFMGGFDSLTDDATWHIIGTTALSKKFTKPQLITDMIPMLSTFKEPAQMGVYDFIAEGDRVAVVAKVEGVGPHGPYVQDPYCFVLRIRDGQVCEIIEFLDTCAVETALVGRRFAD